jgi:hypothetical protein
MIQANELRIGNLFWENYGGYKIVSGINCHKNEFPITVDAHGIGFTAIGRFDLESIQPISLTPEILEKCGFDSINFDNPNSNVDFTFTNNPQYWIQYHTDVDQYIFYGTSNSIEKPIKYLHQLQNLYFALTGEELTFKQ